MDAATQQLFAFIFGVVFILLLIVIAVFIKEPTPSQYNVFRTVLCLAGGGIAAMVPGFLLVEINPSTQLLIRAGGALAAFTILYFFNPAKLGASPSKETTNSPITINQFVYGGGSVAQQNEFFQHEIGFTSTVSKQYSSDQFIAYKEVWRSLQALQVLGEDLWHRATNENVAKFALQLKDTKRLVDHYALCFDENDFAHLKDVLRDFANFRIGKLHLIEIRSAKDVEEFGYRVAEQIEKNHSYKLKYETILEKIRVSFRNKLNQLAQSS